MEKQPSQRSRRAFSLACMLLLPGSLLAAPAASASSGSPPLLDTLFQDHTVIQRDTAVPVWGQAKPGESLKVTFDGKTTTSRADAYFAGEGPTRLIVLGDTLLHGYQPEEIAAIVAHEMGHLGEPRWTPRLLSALAAFLGVLGIQQLLGFCARRRWFGLGAPTDIVGYLLIFFAFELISVAVTPIANWRSRTRESDADAYALRLTGDAQHFLSMMAKLTTQNRADPIPPLYMELWRAGHPASARRLAMGLRYASAHGLRLVLPPPQDASKAGNGEAAAPTPERAPSLEPRTPDAPPTSSLQPPTPP